MTGGRGRVTEATRPLPPYPCSSNTGGADFAGASLRVVA